MSDPFSASAPPAQRHSPTSRAAAAHIEPMAGTKRAKVLDFIRSRGQEGATDEEMQIYIPMVPNTQRPRRVELVAGHFIVDSGRVRATSSGLLAVVWVVAPPHPAGAPNGS